MEQQVTIAIPDGQLVGFLHVPASAPLAALVQCPPLFEERKTSSRPMVELARLLCAEGWVVLRFDYRGCGDSSGSFDRFSLPDWLADLDTACDWLRAGYRDLPLSLFGVRIGASMAFLGACRRNDVRSLALWAAVPDGEQFVNGELRKKLMKEMLTFGGNRTTREALLQELRAGRSIDFDGFELTPGHFSDIIAVKLAPRVEELSVDRAVLFDIGPSGRPDAASLELVRSVQQVAEVSHRVLRMQAFWNQLGLVDCGELVNATQAEMRGKITG